MTIPQYGGAEVLRADTSFPEPRPAAGEALVRVSATGVNRMDFLVRGGYPGLNLPLPHICGADIAGTVEAIGRDVDGIAVGTRVVVYPLVSCGHCRLCRSGRPNLCGNWQCIGLHRKGGYAEYVSVPAANVFPLPHSISFEQAVALPVAGLTAYHAVHSVAEIRPDQTFFVWGGAGTLGSMVVQIARAAGARVLTSVSDDSRARAVRELGAEVVIDRTKEDVLETVRGAVEDGVDVVFDTIGSETYATSFEMVGNGGKLLLSGIQSGRTAELNIHQTYYHHRSLHGLFLGSRADMQGVIDLMERGTIRPLIDSVLPLRDAVEAQRKVESGASVGKVVLSI